MRIAKHPVIRIITALQSGADIVFLAAAVFEHWGGLHGCCVAVLAVLLFAVLPPLRRAILAAASCLAVFLHYAAA